MFFNALEIEKMEKNHYLFYEPGKEIPFAVETYRIKGNFRENLELWDFPLDYQVLYINLFFSFFFVLLLTAFQQHMNSAHSSVSVSVFHCHQLIILRPLSRSLLQKVHNDTSVACDWYISIRPFLFYSMI